MFVFLVPEKPLIQVQTTWKNFWIIDNLVENLEILGGIKNLQIWNMSANLGISIPGKHKKRLTIESDDDDDRTESKNDDDITKRKDADDDLIERKYDDNENDTRDSEDANSMQIKKDLKISQYFSISSQDTVDTSILTTFTDYSSNMTSTIGPKMTSTTRNHTTTEQSLVIIRKGVNILHKMDDLLSIDYCFSFP